MLAFTTPCKEHSPINQRRCRTSSCGSLASCHCTSQRQGRAGSWDWRKPLVERTESQPSAAYLCAGLRECIHRRRKCNRRAIGRRTGATRRGNSSWGGRRPGDVFDAVGSSQMPAALRLFGVHSQHRPERFHRSLVALLKRRCAAGKPICWNSPSFRTSIPLATQPFVCPNYKNRLPYKTLIAFRALCKAAIVISSAHVASFHRH